MNDPTAAAHLSILVAICALIAMLAFSTWGKK